MKRLLSLLLLAPLFLIFVNLGVARQARAAVLAVGSSGTNASAALVPINPSPNNLNGETHSYSLILKGNGNAVVLGRINFDNNTGNDISNYQLEIPNLNPENLVAYQEIPRLTCTLYQPEHSPLEGGDAACAQFSIPPYPEYHNSDYKKLAFQKDGNKLNFSLAEKVHEASYSALIISYNSTKYVSERFGRFDFNFETPKVVSPIAQMNVSIDTDNQRLFLNVDGEQVNYGTATPIASEALNTKGTDSLKLIVPNIGLGGRVYKTVTSLAPGETVKIKGSYASSVLLLNLNKIAVFGGSLLLLIILLVLLIRSGLLSRIGSVVNNKKLAGNNLVLVDFSFGLFSSLLVGGSVLFIKHFLGNQSNYFGYNPDFSLNVLLGILLFLFYGVVLVLPGVLLAIKFGLKHLLIYVLFLAFWLVVLIVGYALIFLPGNQTQNFGIRPLGTTGVMEKGVAPITTSVQTN